MELRQLCKDKRLGLSLRELRDFVAQTESWPGDEYLDCYVASEDDSDPVVHAMVGIYASADIPCPRCGKALMGAPVMQSLSRVDNKTRICSGCGNDEAMWDMTRHDEDMPPVDRLCR